jgi:predicted DCC family thiol-disulfide oxidoreductase YuxK
MSEQTQLTVFYDGHCPLCVKEIRAMKRADKENLLQLENIHASDFSQRYPEVDPVEADKLLHAIDHNGEWLTGLDVTVKAWQLVRRHRWLGVLRWPVIRPVADGCYRFFARYRQQIAFLLTGQRRCDRCVDDL